MSNGTTIYNGPSQINGADIKAIITGTKTKSVNVKTGDMAQMWMFSADVKPTEAAKTGADSAVCGECPHRPLLAKANNVKECYVNLGQAPNGIFKAKYDNGVPTVKKPLHASMETTGIPTVQDSFNGICGLNRRANRSARHGLAHVQSTQGRRRTNAWRDSMSSI